MSVQEPRQCSRAWSHIFWWLILFEVSGEVLRKASLSWVLKNRRQTSPGPISVWGRRMPRSEGWSSGNQEELDVTKEGGVGGGIIKNSAVPVTIRCNQICIFRSLLWRQGLRSPNTLLLSLLSDPLTFNLSISSSQLFINYLEDYF